jgi:hypothetical protein
MSEQAPEATNDQAPALDVIGDGDDFAGDEIDVDEYGEPKQWPT